MLEIMLKKPYFDGMNRRLNRISLVLVILLGMTVRNYSQYLSMGFKGGAVMYDGDLNTNLFITNLTNTRLAYSTFVKFNFKDYFGFQFNFMRGKLYGDDSKSLLDWQITRNLNFHSTITEASFLLEIHLSQFLKKSYRVRKFHPYSFVGLGLFHFNPKTYYQGEEIELQALGTEGQGIEGYPDKYKKHAYSIPFGLGFKYPLNKHVFLGLELSTRWTLTDYIDDISQYYLDYDFLKDHNGELAAILSNRSGELEGRTRKDLTGINRGNNSNDSFYTAMVNLSYRFVQAPYQKQQKRRLKRNRIACPKF